MKVKKSVVVFNIIFLIITTIIFFRTVFDNNSSYIEFSTSKVIFMVFINIIILFLLEKSVKSNRAKNIILISYCIIVFAIQLVIVFTCYTRIGEWDCSIIVNNAIHLIDNRGFNKGYFMKYPNNIGLLLFFKAFLSLIFKCNIVKTWIALDILNVIVIDISIWITYLVAKEIFGKEKAYLSLFFLLPLIAITPYIIVPYSDTFGMIFPILIFYLYLKREKIDTKLKYLVDILIGLLLGIGMIIKPFCIIVAIAIVIIDVIYRENHQLLDLFIRVMLCILGVLLVYASFSMIKDKSLGSEISEEEYQQNEFPFTHFIMMGLRTTKRENGKFTYGGYNRKDVTKTSSYKGKKEKIEHNLEEIKQRLSNMGCGGYINFLYQKTSQILADGTFFFGQEGKTGFYKERPELNSNFKKTLYSYFDAETENFNSKSVNFYQAIWLTCQIFIIGTVVNIKQEFKNKNIILIQLTITGLILFLVLFEARSRYLISYLTYFALLATHGMILIENRKCFPKMRKNINCY